MKVLIPKNNIVHNHSYHQHARYIAIFTIFVVSEKNVPSTLILNICNSYVPRETDVGCLFGIVRETFAEFQFLLT